MPNATKICINKNTMPQEYLYPKVYDFPPMNLTSSPTYST